MWPIATNVLTLRGLSGCVLVMTMSPAKTAEPIKMPFGADSYGSKKHIRWVCTLAPTGEYDGSICAAVAIRPLAVITIATCFVLISYCQPC